MKAEAIMNCRFSAHLEIQKATLKKMASAMGQVFNFESEEVTSCIL